MMTEVPPPDPTEGSDLDEPTDWLAYPHQQLYDMVHNGVDLTGAADVATSWGSLADTLVQMSQTLSQALAASTEGWQGAAADQARNSLNDLVTWTYNTGNSANGVSGCVSRQADALQTARAAMPKPVAPTPPGIPIPGSADSGQTTSSAFAQPPVASPGPVLLQSQQAEAHQQAARVMQQYQQSSAGVATTIPQFAAPTNPLAGPRQAPIAPPSSPPTQGNPPATGPVVGGLGGGASGSGEPSAGADSAAPSTSEPAPSTGSGQASSSGTSNVTEPTAQSGRAPMGGLGGAGARRGEDQEHKRKYWQEDDGLFDLPQRTVPPVIGEERRG